jgi:glycosyltransferase involved in cell wall biosynthesis
MKLSVIIPTYNRANLLPEMVRSLFGQSYETIEIVIVDDGSTDDTAAVVERLKTEKRRNRIELHYLRQENKGAPAARNEGIRQSTGDYILLADSDDIVTQDGIAAGMMRLSQDNLDYVYLPVLKVNSQGEKTTESFVGHPVSETDGFWLDFNWHTMGAIYSRELVKTVGDWNEDLPCSQDWEFQVRVKLSGAKGGFVDKAIGIWNVHSGPRIGVGGYRSEYVAGVLMACESIRDHCDRAGKLTDTVKNRLFSRLIRHALECGSCDDKRLRKRILKVSEPLAVGGGSRVFLVFLRLLPWRWSDWMLHGIICRLY